MMDRFGTGHKGLRLKRFYHLYHKESRGRRRMFGTPDPRPPLGYGEEQECKLDSRFRSSVGWFYLQIILHQFRCLAGRRSPRNPSFPFLSQRGITHPIRVIRRSTLQMIFEPSVGLVASKSLPLSHNSEKAEYTHIFFRPEA